MTYIIIIGALFAIAAYIILKDRKTKPSSNVGGGNGGNGGSDKLPVIESETLNPSEDNV